MSLRTPTVLIVDDTLENLRVLGEMLELDGHEVRIASQGAQALEMARLSPPDLILLDVMMPEMDGHEVCRRLKSNPDTAEIPVIFLTALTDEADEAQGLDLGAVDYVTKPFKMTLVRKRIQNHLKLAQLQSELKEYNSRLEELVAARATELSTANQRLKALDSTKTQFLRLLAQEVQAPANGMVGIGQLALKSIDDPAKRQRLQQLFENNKGRLDAILAQYQRLVDFQEAGHGQLHPLRLEEALLAAWRHHLVLAEAKELTYPNFPARSFIAASEPELLAAALDPLFALLIDAAEPGTALDCSLEDRGTVVRAVVSVHGNQPAPASGLEGLNRGENLALATVVLSALGATARLDPGAESVWELRLEFPRYGA